MDPLFAFHNNSMKEVGRHLFHFIDEKSPESVASSCLLDLKQRASGSSGPIPQFLSRNGVIVNMKSNQATGLTILFLLIRI